MEPGTALASNARVTASDTAHTFLRSLFIELLQGERSAALYCGREAERLGDRAPGGALRAIARHAEEQLPAIKALAEARGVPTAEAGAAFGRFFSDTRELVADHALSTERSYRMTLLRARHGVDLVQMLRDLAHQQGDPALEAFCSTWLRERKPMVGVASDQLRWLAAHPDEAITTSKRGRPVALLGRLFSPA